MPVKGKKISLLKITTKIRGIWEIQNARKYSQHIWAWKVKNEYEISKCEFEKSHNRTHRILDNLSVVVCAIQKEKLLRNKGKEEKEDNNYKISSQMWMNFHIKGNK